MANSNEAQTIEGQEKETAGVADVTGMSVEEISSKIDDDAGFARAYMDGKIVDNTPKPEGEADAAGEPAAETPANPPGDETVVTEDPPPAEAKVEAFTIKPEDLPAGFDTPGKVFKSLSEKQAYIEQVQGQVRQRDQRIQELEAKLQTEADAKKKADEEIRTQADEEIDDAKLYDPDYMKAQLKRLRKMDQIESELGKLKTQVNESQQKDRQKQAVSGELRALRDFQAQYPALKTAKTFEELDAEYATFVEGISTLTKSPTMADALKYVNVYLSDKGDDGNNLRAAAAQAKLKAPDEIAPYLKIMTVRQTAQQVVKIDPVTQKPRQLSLEEAFKLTYPDLYVQGGKPDGGTPPPAKGPSDKEILTKEKEAQRQAAERLANGSAADIPPSASGASESADDLSDQQIDELFKLTPAQLRTQPAKKKLLDDVYRRLGMPVLNVKGVKNALV